MRTLSGAISNCRSGLVAVLLAWSAFGLARLSAADPMGAPLPGDPDWQMELLASAPQVVHPSVVAVAPDGRIFVAEDPMDISAPRADTPAGRIRCIHRDGHISTFAEGLYAVFGMKVLDGRLYVLHNPKFSVFTLGEETVGERQDLIESTHPQPWALEWNDHVPANFGLAMDGFFYLAVGDKGLYHCRGTDGRQVDLHGGGIVRLRPDGSGLELFSTGVRNILDVAITSEDDLFTYDNTDEQQWMSRVTHMIDGGFYGYPFDFVPPRPYTLWMMTDYGGGAATGALAYTEDAWPATYHDNLLLADFGKRQILRLELKRAGGSFQVVARHDLFPTPPDDFRPVGICLDETGASLLICDWQHADTKEPVSVGRLWRLRYRKAAATPRPHWYTDAAMGRVFEASVGELRAALGHPARTVRLVAQRRLAERGRQEPDRGIVADELEELVHDRVSEPTARMHALWALGSIAPENAIQTSAALLQETDTPAIQRQALRLLGTWPAGTASGGLVRYLHHDDRSLRTAAAIALGRQADERVCNDLLTALDDHDLFARYSAWTALSRIGQRCPAAWPAIVAALAHESPRIREGAGFALREQYSDSLVRALEDFVESPGHDGEARRHAVETLAGLARTTAPWQGEWWAYHPVNLPLPVKAQAWESTARIEAALRAMLHDAEPNVRLAAAIAAGKLRDVAAAPALRDLARTDPHLGVRQTALRALGMLRDQATAPLVQELLADPQLDDELLAVAISVAGHLGSGALEPSLVALCRRTEDPQLLALAAAELGRFSGGEAIIELNRLARHPVDEVALAAIEAFGHMANDAARNALIQLANEAGVPRSTAAIRSLAQRPSAGLVLHYLDWCQRPLLYDEAASALTQTADPRGLPIYVQLLNGDNAALRSAAEEAIRKRADEHWPELERQADQLAPRAIAALQRIYSAKAGASGGKLMAIRSAVPSRAAYQEFAMGHAGDASRGRQLFADQRGAGCIKCHANLHAQQEKATLGPDLTTIGTQYSRAALIEHVLWPNLAIREGYQQWTITTSDGRVQSGLARGETADHYLLVDREQTLHAIDKLDVEERVSSPVSLMPEGLEQGLSLADFADLIAFLESCRAAPP